MRMELTHLRREVLPPRRSPCDPCDLVTEQRVRAAVTRAVWTVLVLVGVVNVLVYFLEVGP